MVVSGIYKRRLGGLLLCLCAWGAGTDAAWALELELRAQVGDTYRVIQGEICASEPVGWLSPLADLPLPANDLERPRTYPGRSETGLVDWTEAGEGCVAFVTELPERFAALGTLSDRGLWANGGWYPLPVLGTDRMPLVEWSASVALPPGAVGALNDSVGEASITWEGESHRLALSVLANGEAQTVSKGALEVVLVSDELRFQHIPQEISLLAAEAWTVDQPGRVVVVLAPMYRRLTRAGPGQLFLSEYAFRVSPSLARYHRASVAKALLESSLPLSDPWHRAIAADALGSAAARRVNAREPKRLLARLGLPPAHTMFYDGRTLFLSDLFEEALPSDPLPDDLLERFRPRVPGGLVSSWIDTLGGTGAGEAVAESLLAGNSLAESFVEQGLDGELAEAWTRPIPPQDLILEVKPGPSPQLRMERQTTADAPPQPVVVDVDGERHVWLTSSGPDWRLQAYDERVKRVWLDPVREVAQEDRGNDRWPRGVSVIPGFNLYGIHLTEQRYEGMAWATIRRPYNTHRLVQVVLSHDERNILSLDGLIARYLGPHRDRMRREHMVWLSGTTGRLDPEYQPTEQGRYNLNLGLGYSWDTRVSPYFPEKGFRLWSDASGGRVLGSESFWMQAGAGLKGVRAFHPRHAVAGRLGLGWMHGNIEHRMLGLGGSSGLYSVPSSVVLGRRKAVVAGEYRVVALDHLSAHVPFYWVSQVQLSGGLEGAWLDEEAVLEPPAGVLGLGGNIGISVVADSLGLRPTLGGITFSRLIWQAPEFYEDPQVLVLLRISQLY